MADKEEVFKYVVRSDGGEVKFHSFGEIEQAYLSGLVGPDDEIREANGEKWRKASSYPVLKNARRQGDQVWGGTQMAWIMLALVLGTLSLWLILKGVNTNAPAYWISGLLLALGLGGLLTRVTVNAFKRTRPH